MNIQRLLPKLLSFVGALSLLVAFVFLGSAIYSSATIPAGHVNESILGDILAVVSGAFGAVLLAIAVALRARQRVVP
jgi:hypothetical protein